MEKIVENKFEKKYTRRSFLWALSSLALLVKSIPGRQTKNTQVMAAKCVGCKECVKVCPVRGAISMVRGKAVIDPQTCINCRLCVAVCSYGAVKQCEKD